MSFEAEDVDLLKDMLIEKGSAPLIYAPSIDSIPQSRCVIQYGGLEARFQQVASCHYHIEEKKHWGRWRGEGGDGGGTFYPANDHFTD
jgi:hypothetical protein